MSNFESDESFKPLIEDVNKAGRRANRRHRLTMGAKMAGASFMAATGLVLAADLELAALNQDSVAHIVTNAGELGAVCGVILGTAETIYELKDYKKLLNLKALPKTLARHFTLQSEYIRPMMILKLLTLKK